MTPSISIFYDESRIEIASSIESCMFMEVPLWIRVVKDLAGTAHGKGGGLNQRKGTTKKKGQRQKKKKKKRERERERKKKQTKNHVCFNEAPEVTTTA